MVAEEWLGPFLQQSLVELLDERHPQLWSMEAGTPIPVQVPPLKLGKQMMSLIPVREEFPEPVDYVSRIPWVCMGLDVKVNGPIGILRVGDCVIADSIAWHGRGAHHRSSGEQVLLRGGGTKRRLSGMTLSLLGNNINYGNYYHWTMDGIGRLSALDESTILNCRQVLAPPITTDFQRAGMALAGLDGMEVIEMGDGDDLAVDELVLPWAPMENFRPHPGLREFFTRMADRCEAPSSDWPRRFYVDRRHASNRMLMNEAEVVAAMRCVGFVPVRLELLSMPQQIALFRQAECVVAPHGAGLTNLIFAPADCRVVELQMDCYVHWAFRVIAALGGLRYDCVVGKQLPECIGTLHDQRWIVSVTHVMSAVEAALSG